MSAGSKTGRQAAAGGAGRCCPWAAGSPKLQAYHDQRWCRPEHREAELFALLVLEGMQAGLSWSLILEREEAIRAAFDGLRPEAVAAYGEAKLAELAARRDIIANRLKLKGAVTNARAFLAVAEEWGSFDSYIWHFTAGQVVDHRLEEGQEPPSQDALSAAVAADLRRRGFKFVGPVIIYSYLQAIGVINDHLLSCPARD